MIEVKTPREYQEAYGDMMLNGLSTGRTYIPLRTNKRFGINIAIQPHVYRASEGVVVFGGKLRVGYTIEDNGDYEKSKIVDLYAEDRIKRLEEFCKGFSWQKQDHRRFSTIVGIGVAAGPYDIEVLDKLVEGGHALDFINKLEATYSKYNDGAVFQAKRKAAAALQDAWLIQADGWFKPMPEATKVPEKALGKTSKVLNKATEKYTDNVVSFQSKVEELKAKYAE